MCAQCSQPYACLPPCLHPRLPTPVQRRWPVPGQAPHHPQGSHLPALRGLPDRPVRRHRLRHLPRRRPAQPCSAAERDLEHRRARLRLPPRLWPAIGAWGWSGMWGWCQRQHGRCAMHACTVVKVQPGLLTPVPHPPSTHTHLPPFPHPSLLPPLLAGLCRQGHAALFGAVARHRVCLVQQRGRRGAGHLAVLGHHHHRVQPQRRHHRGVVVQLRGHHAAAAAVLCLQRHHRRDAQLCVQHAPHRHAGLLKLRGRLRHHKLHDPGE